MRSREIRACLTCYYNVDDRCFAKPTIVRDGEARHPAIFSKMDCCDRCRKKIHITPVSQKVGQCIVPVYHPGLSIVLCSVAMTA